MTTHRLLRVLTAGVAVGSAVGLLFPGAARASCVAPPPVDQAVAEGDVVMVGTVTATRSRDRIATIRVEEVWKGRVDGEVEVHGGPASENSATSVDRTWTVGGRYLVFAREPAARGDPATFGGRYEDNACSNTQPYTPALDVHRPDGATTVDTGAPGTPPQPTASGSDSSRGRAGRVALTAAGLVGLGATEVWLRRRKSGADALSS